MVQLDGRTILITGGEGFIGRRLAERLDEAGAHVRVLARDLTRPARGWERMAGDVTLPLTVSAAVTNCELVFHCAAAGGGPLAAARAVNVQGTRNVMDAALASGTVRRVVHVSSVAAHGPNLPALAVEDQPLVIAGSSYAVSKAEGELAAMAYQGRSDLEVVVIRPTCVYGPGSRTWILAPFSRVRDEQVLLIGGGAGIINLIYVDDLVELLIAAATIPHAAGESFIASGGPVRWSDYLCAFARMQNKPFPPAVPVWWAYVLAQVDLWRFRFTRKMPRVQLGDISEQTSRTVFGIAKAQRLLGFTPRTSFLDGMHRTETWLRTYGYLGDRIHGNVRPGTLTLPAARRCG